MQGLFFRKLIKIPLETFFNNFILIAWLRGLFSAVISTNILKLFPVLHFHAKDLKFSTVLFFALFKITNQDIQVERIASEKETKSCFVHPGLHRRSGHNNAQRGFIASETICATQ